MAITKKENIGNIWHEVVKTISGGVSKKLFPLQLKKLKKLFYTPKKKK